MKAKVLSLILFLFPLSFFILNSSYAEQSLDEYGVKNKVNVVTQLDSNDWIIFPSKQDVPLKKTWTVTFSDIVTFDKIDGAVIEKNNQFIPVKIDFSGDTQLVISPVNTYEANASYTLKVFLNNGRKYKMEFNTTDDTNSLIEPIYLDVIDAQIIRVPAMPEKGFNFPYYIRIPSTNYKNQNDNLNEKRYIIMDTANSGPSSLDGTEYWVKETLKNQSQLTVQVAEQMWTPMIMPTTPRSHVCYGYGSDPNCIDEHSFDRDIVRLDKLLSENHGKEIEYGYQSKGLIAQDYLNYDKQLIAMFEHAAQYLNSYNQNVQIDKMILTGYSSGGTFSDRFTMLHPERVKAVASGATLDDMVMPVTSHKGQTLVFPVGISDYKQITGKNFDINAINKVAKLIYMGKSDNNVTLPYTDAFSEEERQSIIKAFSENTLERAYSMMNLYHESGGEAMFILDKDIEHGVSNEMAQYQLEFLLANRKSNTPVYPAPKNTMQLEYQVHQ